MFGFFKKKETYPDLTFKYHSLLRRDLDVNAYYTDAFIKKRGDSLSSSEFNVRKGNETSDVSSGIKKIILDYGYEHFTLVSVCIGIYLYELKAGKYVSDEEELVAVGILIKLKHITSKLDLNFSDWLEKNHNSKWPGLFKKVFVNN